MTIPRPGLITERFVDQRGQTVSVYFDSERISVAVLVPRRGIGPNPITGHRPMCWVTLWEGYARKPVDYARSESEAIAFCRSRFQET